MTTATRTVKEALDALRRAQKPAKGTAAYSRHVNRPLGRQVAAVVSTVGMTPNQVTLIGAILCVVISIPLGMLAARGVGPRWLRFILRRSRVAVAPR